MIKTLNQNYASCFIWKINGVYKIKLVTKNNIIKQFSLSNLDNLKLIVKQKYNLEISNLVKFSFLEPSEGLPINNEQMPNLDEITLSDIYSEWIQYEALKLKNHHKLSQIKQCWTKYFANSYISSTPIKCFDIAFYKIWTNDFIKKNKYNILAFAILKDITTFIHLSGIPINYVYKDEYHLLYTNNTDTYFSDKELNILYNAFINRYFDFSFTTASLAILLSFETGIPFDKLLTIKFTDINNKILYIKSQNNEPSFSLVETKREGYQDYQLNKAALQLINFLEKQYIEQNISTENIFINMDSNLLTLRAIENTFRTVCRKNDILIKKIRKNRNKTISNIIINNLK